MDMGSIVMQLVVAIVGLANVKVQDWLQKLMNHDDVRLMRGLGQ